jgi:hypothetical protein
MALHTVIAVGDLREGDLLHAGDTNYVLVAGARLQDGQVRVILYDGSTPRTEPTLCYAPGEQVRLSMRGLSPDSVIRTRMHWDTYFNQTPGHAPDGSRGIPVGAVVDVRPAAGGGPAWRGRVQAHQHSKASGRYLGMSVIEPAGPDGTSHHTAGAGQFAEVGGLVLISS